MRIPVQITQGIQKGTEIYFLAEESQLVGLVPTGKMITDSEKHSFVYLYDEAEQYGHIHFPQSVWPLMVETLKSEVDPLVVIGNEEIRLINFVEELTMLIFNIEGNNNYGEDFSIAVEKEFAEILESAE